MRLKNVTKILAVAALAAAAPVTHAQGWPSGYGGVMLQGFYWDSYSDTNWATLAAQASDMAGYIDLLWIPNAGNCGSGNQMGYSPQYWFSNYSGSFGTETQLRSLVSAMSAVNIGIIGDVVINHRNTTNGWFGYPSETFNGNTYALTSTDIVADDDGGQAAYVAAQQGVTLSSNNDTGDGWTGIRDLDHMSNNVQTCVKAYLRDKLISDLGYAGFRYDMVSGFSASYIGVYNTYAAPQFSVGECWKDGSTIQAWIDGTKVNGTPTSAAFDFQFRYTIRNAINGSSWSELSNQNGSQGYPLISNSNNSGAYKQWAVTFVENHDTQYRDADNTNDPITADTIAANAYMLAMPGTPCIFLPHWKAYRVELKNMIAARKAAGITNTSAYSVSSTNANRYMTSTTGSKTSLICAIGSNTSSYAGPNNSVEILKGYHYKYFMPASANIAWVDVPSGTYDEAFDVKLTAVSSSYTTLVYTTDGSAPSASNGTQVSSGSTVHVDADMTLRVGLLNGSNIVNGSTLERSYSVQETNKITVYLKSPGWSNVCFYCYNRNDGVSNDSWPGVSVVANTVTRGGETFYYRTFESTASNLNFMVIFNNGNSGNDNQTVNIGPVSEDVYYEITGGGGSSKLTVTDVTEQYGNLPEWEFGLTGAGVFGGWDPADPLLFTYNSDGTYTLSITGATMSELKVSRLAYGTTFDGWTTFNDGCMGASSLAEGDNTLSTSFGTGNMTFPVAGDVTLTISDITSTTCNLNITVDNAVEVEPEFYLAGTVNSWSGNNSEYKFTDNGDDTYTLTKTFSGEFKIVDESGNWWSTSSATTITDSTPLTLSQGGNGNNMTLSEERAYTLTVTVSGNAKTLTVTGFASSDTAAHTYVLRGATNNWSGDTDAFTYQGDGVYTLTKTFSGEFKVVRDGSDWMANEYYFTFNYVYDNVTLNSVGGNDNNMNLSGDARQYTLTITGGNGDSPVLTVSNLPQLPQAYYLIGAFNEWAADVPFVESGGVFSLTQTLNGEFLVKDQYGQYMGGVTNEEVYTLHMGWRSVELATDAQGKKNLKINDEAEYTFTIENGVLSVSGWAGGVSLAQAIAGQTGTISDELTVVKVYGGKVYATDGNDSWVRLDGVSNAGSMSPGYVIDSYQLSAAVSSPLLAPAIAVNGELSGSSSDNIPVPRDIYLSNGYKIGNDVIYPTAGEVVTIRGYFFYQGGEPALFAYSGERGTKGMHLLLDTDADMQEGKPYAVDVVISLAQAWQSASSGAPRRVSPADGDAYTNLRGTVVGSPAITTGVIEIAGGARVQSVKYVSLSGQMSDRPFDGVNVVVTTYSDGTVRTVKAMR
ncbi:MAG: starch-binding protein [Muribaculaceae bacterium]|nr:starch-binding protein [Muribaculaceae bacterium]